MSEAAKTKKRDPVVYALSKPSRCFNCDQKLVANDIVRLNNKEDEKEVLCKICGGLADYAFVAKGDSKLTRDASKQSPTRYAVMKWSELWKCYERQGVLVERAILEKLQNAPTSGRE